MEAEREDVRDYGCGVAEGNWVSTTTYTLHVPHSSVGEPPHCSSLTRVGAPSRRSCCQLLIRVLVGPGATHLYLLDFVPDNLPELKETIQKKYPDVKVSFTRQSPKTSADVLKVTTLQADAADETAISSVCEQALKDEGRLDVFFANVSSIQSTPSPLN